MVSTLEIPELVLTTTKFDSRILELLGIIEFAQETFENANKEWRQNIDVLKTHLAKSASFRKKDFDQVVGGILKFQEERETDVRLAFSSYLREQKEFLTTVKNLVTGIENSTEMGSMIQIRKSQDQFILLKENFEKQELAFKTSLDTFRQEQQTISQAFQKLLQRDKLSAADLKNTVVSLLDRLTNFADDKIKKDCSRNKAA